MIGLYVHVPFCDGKCPYCDFYSINGDEHLKNIYTQAVIREMQCYTDDDICADSLYFGGGTPVLLGADNLCSIIDTAKSVFALDGEITVEANPSGDLYDILNRLSCCGVNRISIGMQSAIDDELRLLGRRHSSAQTAKAVEAAKNSSINNISVDLMLGIPNQTEDSMLESIKYAANLGVTHISAYLLKVEPNTPFFKKREELSLPDDDTCADLYLSACEALEEYGFVQYEISNFAKNGFSSIHNLKYWHCCEYLGFGAGAHSFHKGHRFYHKRDIDAYLRGENPIDDGIGGSFDEKAMLQLRLTEGLHGDIPDNIMKKARELISCGLTECDHQSIRLTRKGLLLSNEVISHILL